MDNSESNDLYKIFIDASNDMIFLKDEKGKYIIVNKHYLEYIGKKEEDIIGRTGFEFRPPETAEQCDQSDRKALAMNDIVVNEEIIHGRILETRKFPVRLGKGKIGIGCFMRDITDHRRTEQAARASEEKYHRLFDMESDAIFLIDNETGQILEANNAAASLYGYSREELLTKNHRDMSAEPEQTRDATMKELTVVPLRYHRKKDGTVFPVEITATHLIWKGRKSHLAAIRDITRREMAEKELRATLEKLRASLGATVRAMAVTVETRDPYTAGHQKRVTNLARTIAQEMNLHNDIVDGIRMAGLIHDIGKISVPAEILSKPTKLTETEFKIIKIHPEAGYAILKDIDFPWPVANIVLQHHERLDGSGYPNRLKGEQILFEAQVLSVADVVEAMASHRPYRPGFGIDVALEEIEKNKGILYNAKVANTCVRLFREEQFRFE
ncbi:MAG TPA: PAS domain S-box protein [Syntrophorhabdaceae bacterium]|nr:PAS domain S-box protein [Syntrophorhabdaceae bacterium]HQM80115.1 PAS domain S-box protein [Syntrophorhabdaceae bacterium]